MYTNRPVDSKKLYIFDENLPLIGISYPWNYCNEFPSLHWTFVNFSENTRCASLIYKYIMLDDTDTLKVNEIWPPTMKVGQAI